MALKLGIPTPEAMASSKLLVVLSEKGMEVFVRSKSAKIDE